ncbi:hypothetical protein TNCV_2360791 [Trichonephila clavipes]|nr:hypothetical protein TNCV_2360791 [Trichonephila clavipes]
MKRWYPQVGVSQPRTPGYPDLNPLDFFWSHLKSLLYEISMATVTDPSLTLLANQICLNAYDNPSTNAINFADATSNNSSDNDL